MGHLSPSSGLGPQCHTQVAEPLCQWPLEEPATGQWAHGCRGTGKVPWLWAGQGPVPALLCSLTCSLALPGLHASTLLSEVPFPTALPAAV